MFSIQFRWALLAVAIFATSTLATPEANAQVSGNGYVGDVYLQTQAGQIVRYRWDLTFNNKGAVSLTANGVPIYGKFFESGTSFATLLDNPPFYSSFAGRTFGPFLLLDRFNDGDGNSLYYGFLYPK